MAVPIYSWRVNDANDMPVPSPQPSPPPDDGVRIVGRIGTDPEELRRWADAVVDRGEPIKDMEIADLRALIEAVQKHPRVKLAPAWKRGDPAQSDESLEGVTALRIEGGRVLKAECNRLDIRVTLAAHCRFEDGASFEVSTFAGAAEFGGATFAEQAGFRGATFAERARFGGATFARMAWFYEATFAEEAGFGGATFAGPAWFYKATFAGWTDFCCATFAGKTEFGEATFAGVAWFDCADVRGVKFEGLNLRHCTLAHVRNMRLDGNDLKEVRFPPNTSEAWHTVRRAYTGTKFFFHLIPLTAFLGGYAVRMMMWVGVNRAQVAIVHAADKLEAAAITAAAPPTHPESAVILGDAARELSHLNQSLTQTTREYEVWQVLLGLDRGWSTCALAVVLIAYNILRGYLTHDVGAMRDESDRSGFAPYWKDYKRAWYVHTYLMRWLMLIALVSFLWHAWGWLRSPVWLPG